MTDLYKTNTEIKDYKEDLEMLMEVMEVNGYLISACWDVLNIENLKKVGENDEEIAEKLSKSSNLKIAGKY
jgi:hypothetical protein